MGALTPQLAAAAMSPAAAAAATRSRATAAAAAEASLLAGADGTSSSIGTPSDLKGGGERGATAVADSAATGAAANGAAAPAAGTDAPTVPTADGVEDGVLMLPAAEASGPPKGQEATPASAPAGSFAAAAQAAAARLPLLLQVRKLCALRY